MTDSPDTLRQRHRSARAALSEETLKQHAQALYDNLTAIPELDQARHVAAYIAIRGEISLDPTIRGLEMRGAQCYLPVLRGEQMNFAPWHSDQPLEKKGMGLFEPSAPESAWIQPESLDAVLAPLVVFDRQCNRIGQGGGFYDRTFAFRREQHRAGPLLIGVAHHSQQELALPVQAWDVPLDMIVTNQGTYQRPH